MISDEDVISVRGAASLPTRPPAEMWSGPRWHRPSRAPWICRCCSWWQMALARARERRDVSAPIQSHLHPSASLPYPQQWMDAERVCVCVCTCVWWVSSQGDQINPNKGENIRCIWDLVIWYLQKKSFNEIKAEVFFVGEKQFRRIYLA